MTGKDKIYLLAHSKHPEARRAWAVLYWKYQGLTHRQVGQKLFKGKDWVQRYMTMIYKIFETPDIKDKDEKFQWLVNNVFPALKEFLEQNPEVIRALTTDPDINLGKDIDKIDQGEWVDDWEEEEDESDERFKRKDPPFLPPPQTPTIVRLLRYLLFAIVALVALAIVGIVSFRAGFRPFPQIPPPQIITVVVTTTPPPSLVTSSTATSVPSETPTMTLVPTEIPTNTPKPYIDEGEVVFLKDGVFAGLEKNWSTEGGPCNVYGFTIRIYVKNNSDSQFVLTYNTSGFHAVDNFGTQYQLLESGPLNYAEPLGLDMTEYINRGSQEGICVDFKGNLPITAKYVLLTADFISGTGPITFRKDR